MWHFDFFPFFLHVLLRLLCSGWIFLIILTLLAWAQSVEEQECSSTHMLAKVVATQCLSLSCLTYIANVFEPWWSLIRSSSYHHHQLMRAHWFHTFSVTCCILGAHPKRSFHTLYMHVLFSTVVERQVHSLHSSPWCSKKRWSMLMMALEQS